MRSSAIRLVLVAALLLPALPVAAAEAAQTFTVTRTADSNVGGCEPGFCTLRQGIEAAEAAGAGSTVVVPKGTYKLEYGELRVGKPIAIEGAGSTQTIVDGAGKSRVFNFTSGAAGARLAKLTVQNGRIASKFEVPGGGGIVNYGSLTLEAAVVRKNTVNPQTFSNELESGGGGILNKGSLTIIGSEIAENIVEPSVEGVRTNPGSAIQNADTLRIVDSAILRNVAAGVYPQGAISSRRKSFGPPLVPASLELVRTRIEGNRAEAGKDAEVNGMALSAGVYASETNVTIRESTFVGNSDSGPKASAAALYFGSDGSLTFESSTVADNVSKGSESASAAMLISGGRTDPMRIVNSTIVGNEANAPLAAGGVGHFGESNLEIVSSTIVANRAVGAEARSGNLNANQLGVYTTTLRDTIVSAGVAKAGLENCVANKPGVIVSLGHNIDSTNQCGFNAPGDKVNTNPGLAALSANGGPTATMALLAGSPALDAGADCPATDQRGVARPQGPACDIGAYEQVVATPPPAPPVPPRAASLRFLVKKVKVAAKSGKGNFKASCAADPGDRCLVALTLRVKPRRHHGAKASAKKRKAVVGTVSGSIAGGGAGRLRLALNARGRALLRTGSKGFAVTATGTSRNTSGASVSIRHGLRIVPRQTAHH